MGRSSVGIAYCIIQSGSVHGNIMLKTTVD